MTARSYLGEVRRGLLSKVRCRSVAIEDSEPIVSFSFDDFPRTAYTTGGGILKSLGVRGTYYAALGLMNTSNDLGEQMTLGDIDSLLSDGHELGSHTFGHTSCRRVSMDTFERDVLKGRDELGKMTGCEVGSFSYPFGHVSIAAKKLVGAQMDSGRSIYDGINGPWVDLNMLRANSLYGGVDQFTAAESLLRENEKRRGWLIFYTHDVRRDPSLFGCTPELFEQVVTKATESGFRIATIGSVLKAMYAVHG